MMNSRDINPNRDVALNLFGSGLISSMITRDVSSNNLPNRRNEPLTLGQVLKGIERLGAPKNGSANDITLNDTRYNDYLHYVIRFEDIIDFIEWAPTISKADREKTILNYDKLKPNEKSGIIIVNSWLMLVANKLYLEYCAEKNVTPKGRITIAQHLVNEVYTANTKKEIMENIFTFIRKYVEQLGASDWKVYHHCYAKTISEALIKPKDNFEEQNSKIIYDYRGVQDFKFNLLNDPGKENKKQIEIAEYFLNSVLHPESKRFAIGDIDALKHFPGTKYNAAYYDLNERKIRIPRYRQTDASHLIHEFTHEIVNETELWKLCCDILYENTKAQNFTPVKHFDSTYPNSEDLCKGPIKGLPIDASIVFDAKYEKYSNQIELLPMVMSLLLKDIKIETPTKSIFGLRKNNSQMRTMYDINNNIRKQFEANLKLLYKVNRDFALLVLAYMNGQLGKKEGF